MDDTLDPVVQEVPVVLSTEMLRQVYVLQQHMRSAAAPAVTPAGAEFREVNETLTVQYDMDKRSSNYNPDAEEWNQVSSLDFDCHPAPMRTHYVVGSLVEGKLHVAPVHGMYQLRPTLAHVDDGVPNLYADKAKPSAAGVITQVEAKLRRRETQRAAAARKNSHAYAQRLLQSDEPVPLAVHSAGTPSAGECKAAALGLSTAHAPLSELGGQGVGVEAYLQDIHNGKSGVSSAAAGASPLEAAQVAATGIGAQPGISAAVTALAQRESGAGTVATTNLPDPDRVPMDAIRRLPLEERVATLLRRAIAMTLPDLMRLAPAGVAQDDVVSAALAVASPISGLFVLRTPAWLALPRTLRVVAGDAGLDNKAVRKMVETLAEEARVAAVAEGGRGPRTADFSLGLAVPSSRSDLLAPVARTTPAALGRVGAVRDRVLQALLQEGVPGGAGVRMADLAAATGTPPHLLRAMTKGVAVFTPSPHSTRWTFTKAGGVLPETQLQGRWHLLPAAAAAGPALAAQYPAMVQAEASAWATPHARSSAVMSGAGLPPSALVLDQDALEEEGDALGLPHTSAQQLHGVVRQALGEVLGQRRVASVRYLAGRLRVMALEQLQSAGALPPDAVPSSVASAPLPHAVVDAAGSPPATAPLGWVLTLPRPALLQAVHGLVRGGGTAWLLQAAAPAGTAPPTAMPLAPLGEFLGRNEGEGAEAGVGGEVFTPPSLPDAPHASLRDAVIGRYASPGVRALKKAQVRAAVEGATGGGMSEAAYKKVMGELAVNERTAGWVRRAGEWSDAPCVW